MVDVVPTEHTVSIRAESMRGMCWGSVHTARRGIFDCLVDERVEEVLADVAVGQVPLSSEDGRREAGED